MSVYTENEVLIDRKRYKILGTVRDQIVNPFPGQIRFGDPTRSDDVIKSPWASTNWTGGLGIEHGDVERFPDRYDFALLETRFPRKLGLLPYTTQRGSFGTVEHIIPFAGATVFFSGSQVYIRQETDGTLLEIGTLPSTPTDVIVYRGRLWAALGTSFPLYAYDGSEWVRAEPLDDNEGIFGGRLLITHEDQLFVLAGDGYLYSSVDGEEWNRGGHFAQGAGWISQLLIYFDQTETPEIHAVGRDGVYGYDIENGMWMPTPLVYPEHPFIGKACVWQSDLYVPAGLDIYRYNGSVIQSIGPSRDEGLPEQYQGYISRLVPSHPYIYAVINSVFEEEESGEALQRVGQGSPWQHARVRGAYSRGLILCSTGISWHAIWEGGEGVSTAAISTGEGQYRLWWGSGEALYSQDLPKSMHNALRNPATEFREDGFLITSWFDAQWSELDKLASDIKVTAFNITETERFELRMQWDNERNPWEFVGESTPGQQRMVFPIAYREGGRLFRKARIRIDMFRGENKRATPVVDNITFTFLRMPPPVWSYQFTIDLSGEYKGRTEREMRRDLLELLHRRKGFFFAFSDPDHEQRVEKRVIFSRNAGVNLSGMDKRGQVTLSLMSMESEE